MTCADTPRNLVDHHDWKDGDILTRRGEVMSVIGEDADILFDDGTRIAFSTETDFASAPPRKGDVATYQTAEVPCLCGTQKNLRHLETARPV